MYETASKVKLDVGDVDILVNNAGVVTGKDFFSCSDSEIEKTMNVNLMAHYWVSDEKCWGCFLACSGHRPKQSTNIITQRIPSPESMTPL